VLALKDIVFGENTVNIDVPNKHVRGEGNNNNRNRKRRDNNGEERREGGARREGGDRREGGARRYDNRREFNGERKEREVVAGDTVFVGNLAFAIKHDELKDFFDSCGSIVAVRIAMRDELSRGFGYV
jgi:RNA recognition motif-containing protein